MSPLDEQEQINEQGRQISDLADEVHIITGLLLGDKLKDPDSRSLIEDVSNNRKFRMNIESKLYKIAAILGTAILGLTVKAFWGSMITIVSGGQ